MVTRVEHVKPVIGTISSRRSLGSIPRWDNMIKINSFLTGVQKNLLWIVVHRRIFVSYIGLTYPQICDDATVVPIFDKTAIFGTRELLPKPIAPCSLNVIVGK